MTLTSSSFFTTTCVFASHTWTLYFRSQWDSLQYMGHPPELSHVYNCHWLRVRCAIKISFSISPIYLFGNYGWQSEWIPWFQFFQDVSKIWSLIKLMILFWNVYSRKKRNVTYWTDERIISICIGAFFMFTAFKKSWSFDKYSKNVFIDVLQATLHTTYCLLIPVFFSSTGHTETYILLRDKKKVAKSFCRVAGHT